MNIDELKTLAGVNSFKGYTEYTPENLSIPGSEKQRLEKEHKIKPGTPEWFKLWFAKPHLTGERPVE
jgi:hypothetical protein